MLMWIWNAWELWVLAMEEKEQTTVQEYKQKTDE